MARRFPAFLAVLLLALVTVTSGLPLRCLVCCQKCQQASDALTSPNDCAQFSPASPRLAPAERPLVETVAVPGPAFAAAVLPVALAASFVPPPDLEAGASPPPLVLRV